ncbi:MAG: MFS transporter [Pseudomonadota bacterium]|nr:MFS transporter [Pseudomonadota bacterium]
MTSRSWLQLPLLALAMAVAGYVRTAVSPLQEAMRLAWSLGDNQMALLQGPAIGIPVALAAIPLGLLIDRTCRVRLLRWLVGLSMVGSLLTAIANGFAVLLIARSLAGVTALAIVPVAFSLIADLYPPQSRGRATTVIFIGQVAGNSAAFALGGALLAAAPEIDGWRWAMLWLVAPLVPVALMLFALREPPRMGVSIENPSLRQVWRELRRYRATITPLALGIVLVETALGATLIWSAPMLSRRFPLAPDAVGMIMAAGMMISGIAGPVLGGVLADMCQRSGGPRRTLQVLAILAMFGVPAGLFASMPGVTSASILLTVVMTLIIAVATMGMALFTIVIPNELRGLCMAMLSAAILLFALAVAPMAVSVVSGLMGGLAAIGDALSIVCVAAGMMATAAFMVAGRFLPQAVVQSK